MKGRMIMRPIHTQKHTVNKNFKAEGGSENS